jgi:hypothetical protein
MEKKAFRFCGAESVIAGQHMFAFGQVINLTDQEAEALVSVHPPAQIVSPELWARTGITEAECQDWPSVLMHDQAPDDFLVKRKAVWDAMHEYRDAATAKAADQAKQETVQEPSAAPVEKEN